MLLEVHVEQELKETAGVISVNYDEHDEHGLMISIQISGMGQMTKASILMLLEDCGYTFFSNVHQSFRPQRPGDAGSSFAFFRFCTLTDETTDLALIPEKTESEATHHQAAV